MKFALIEGVKREPSRTGERGTCPGCEGGVLAKVGPDRVPHWAHQSNSNCDPWFEPETPWHRAWKALVVPDAQEVTIKRDGSHHRADIWVGEHGPVIELQQSKIALQEMLDREAFYGRMIWLFDGGRFAAGLSDYWFAANRRLGSVPMPGTTLWWRRANINFAHTQKPIYLDLSVTLPGTGEPWNKFSKQLATFWEPCSVDVPRDNFMLRIDGFNGATGMVRVRPVSREIFIGKHLRSVLSADNPRLIRQVSVRRTRLIEAIAESRSERSRRRAENRARAEEQVREERERREREERARARRETGEAATRMRKAVRVEEHRRSLLAQPWDELEVCYAQVLSSKSARKALHFRKDVLSPPRGIPERDWVLAVEYDALVVERREAWLAQIASRAKTDLGWWLRQRERIADKVRASRRPLPPKVHWLWHRLISIDMGAFEARHGEYEAFHARAKTLASGMSGDSFEREQPETTAHDAVHRAARRLMQLAEERESQRTALERASNEAHDRVSAQMEYLRGCEARANPSELATCLAHLDSLTKQHSLARTDLDEFVHRHDELARSVTREEFEDGLRVERGDRRR